MSSGYPNRSDEEKQARLKIIDEYLEHQCVILRKYYNHFPKRINPTSNYAAVIVEPRSDFKSLETICRNVMYFLPEHWNLVVYSYDDNLVKNRLTNMEYIFHKTEKPSLCLEEYSKLLMSQTFWNSIPADNILIFQTDSYITQHFTEDYISNIIKYPFVGALYKIDEVGNYPVGYNICSINHNRKYSMSGGFSFRNKKAMLTCIKNVTIDDIEYYRDTNKLPIINKNQMNYEDLYFEHALYFLGYNLPDEKTCSDFCCQVLYYFTPSRAFHGIYKYYVYEYLIYMLCPSLYDMINEVNKKIDIEINKRD